MPIDAIMSSNFYFVIIVNRLNLELQVHVCKYCFQCSINGFKRTAIFLCQNWEDTEGRKKLSKVNARVSKRTFYQKDVHHSSTQAILRFILIMQKNNNIRPACIGFGD